MNGMRIKSHKPLFSKTNLPRPERLVRYTPLGAIRLLPPVNATTPFVAKATTPVTTPKKRAAKTAASQKATATKRTVRNSKKNAK